MHVDKVSFDDHSLTFWAATGGHFVIRTEEFFCAPSTYTMAVVKVYDASGVLVGRHTSKRADCRAAAFHDLKWIVSEYRYEYAMADSDLFDIYNALESVLFANSFREDS